MHLSLNSFSSEFRNPKLAKSLLKEIHSVALILERPVRFMEVCGTHTQAIFRHGIRGLLPSNIQLVSGPGCPVCVTDQSDLDYAIGLVRQKEVILTTFGDMLRVPGSSTSLELEKNRGALVKIVYSPAESLKIARENPTKKVVFLGIGFETTAPAVAATIIEAETLELRNFFVFARHKLIPPALMFLARQPDLNLDGFICPGHVSVVIGAKAYKEVVETVKIPAVISGFEPLDILSSVLKLCNQLATGEHGLENQYRRVVSETGNERAQEILRQVFVVKDARWRGLGSLPDSGMVINQRYERFDAEANFTVTLPVRKEKKNCRCGEILLGKITPYACPLFAKSCHPQNPQGACMVSFEGTCAAYYRYGKEGLV